MTQRTAIIVVQLLTLFRKYNGEIVNAWNTRKAQAKSELIFKPKSPILFVIGLVFVQGR